MATAIAPKTKFNRDGQQQFVQVSDIRIPDLDCLLRLWISQLLENSLERGASHVDIHLFEKGVSGFDIIDDGEAIPEKEL